MLSPQMLNKNWIYKNSPRIPVMPGMEKLEDLTLDDVESVLYDIIADNLPSKIDGFKYENITVDERKCVRYFDGSLEVLLTSLYRMGVSIKLDGVSVLPVRYVAEIPFDRTKVGRSDDMDVWDIDVICSIVRHFVGQSWWDHIFDPSYIRYRIDPKANCAGFHNFPKRILYKKDNIELDYLYTIKEEDGKFAHHEDGYMRLAGADVPIKGYYTPFELLHPGVLADPDVEVPAEPKTPAKTKPARPAPIRVNPPRACKKARIHS